MPTTTVEFIDTSKEVKQTLVKLSKTALRSSGKVVRKKLREGITGNGLEFTKRFKNYIASWAFINKSTGQPELQVGFYSPSVARKKGKKVSHASPHWIEFGTKAHAIPGASKQGHFMAYGDNVFGFHVQHPGQRGTHLLRDTVYNNIDEIQAAQKEFLAAMNDTLEAAGMKVFEGEEDESD